MQLTFTSVNGIDNRKKYLPLLLEADPDEPMIDRYIGTGDMFIALLGGKAAGCIVSVPVAAGCFEIKNLAVEASLRGQGIARRLIEHAVKNTPAGTGRVIVGTSETGVDFYRKCGFSYSHTVKNFFIDNYPEPIFDSGQQCVDMTYLELLK